MALTPAYHLLLPVRALARDLRRKVVSWPFFFDSSFRKLQSERTVKLRATPRRACECPSGIIVLGRR